MYKLLIGIGNYQQIERQPIEREIIFSNDMTDKELIISKM